MHSVIFFISCMLMNVNKILWFIPKYDNVLARAIHTFIVMGFIVHAHCLLLMLWTYAMPLHLKKPYSHKTAIKAIAVEHELEGLSDLWKVGNTEKQRLNSTSVPSPFIQWVGMTPAAKYLTAKIPFERGWSIIDLHWRNWRTQRGGKRVLDPAKA